jgi:hypothetical protein
MKNKSYFLSTRISENIYKFIVNPAKIHAESKLKSKLEIKYFQHAPYPDIIFIFYIFYVILTGKIFFNKKFINLKYSGYVIGRYALSHSMREGTYYRSKIIFFFSKLKILIIAGKLINSLNQINKSSQAIYIDHGMYINGIILQAAIKKKLIIYSNNYPRGLFCYDFRFFKKKLDLQYEDLLKLTPEKINKKKLIETKKIIKKICYYEKPYPWMSKTKFLNFKNNFDLKNITHIIYAHSFLETQYIFGNDGFLDYEHWLVFTIKKLSRNKENFILIKAHPNFYTKNFSDINYLDSEIFKKIKKKFEKKSNAFFLDYPYKNYHLLNKVSKKTVIVMRHSSALIDAIYFGFKVIFSSANLWNVKYLKAENCWKNINEYEALLEKKWDNLSYFSKSSFYRLCYDLYCNDKNFFGNKCWHTLLINKFKLSLQDYISGNVIKKNLSKRKIIDLQRSIAIKSIEVIKNIY